MVNVSAIQMSFSRDIKDNIKRASYMVEKAATDGANIILLPELFEHQYFCQERNYDYYSFAKPTEENDAVKHFKTIAKKFSVVIPVSFYEKSGNSLFNSVAVIDANGEILGVYRKVHIPDDHYYQEKFYFSPSNKGFCVFKTQFAKIGIGICWDQWFPETARVLSLLGAEILLFPTAIGSEPILECDSSSHWKICMQGHAAANIIPVVAANRYGEEIVKPCKENGFQKSSLNFFGSSFITSETGKIIASAGKAKDAILTSSFDLDKIKKLRLAWGLFRDRRPETYSKICKD